MKSKAQRSSEAAAYAAFVMKARQASERVLQLVLNTVLERVSTEHFQRMHEQHLPGGDAGWHPAPPQVPRGAVPARRRHGHHCHSLLLCRR